MHSQQLPPRIDPRFKKFPEMKEKYPLSRAKINQIADACGAKRKVGSALIYDDEVFEPYFLKVSEI